MRLAIKISLCICILFSRPAWAQDGGEKQATVRVSGVVNYADDGQPLPGVTVALKGTKTVAVTDVDGRYQIAAAAGGTLVFSQKGLKTVEEAIGARREINATLEDDRLQLSEVVVVGYGTQRRRELTGAVATVSSSHLKYNTASSIDALLGGAVAGVNVTQSSGQPGSSSNIRIRGGNSIHAANEPLYVIDGIIIYPRSTQTGAGSSEVAIESSINPLAAINPSDIESISILKDVSATAIFGSRGANGVIIVNTKKGNRGKDVINYTFTAGWSAPAKRLALMDAQEWGKLQIAQFGNKGNLTDAYLASIGKGYDWQNEVLQTGFSQNHDISVSGGDGKTRYLISGNYADQEGIVINSGFKQYNLRVNIDRTVYENLTVGANVTFGKSNQRSLTTSKEVNYNSSPFADGITNSLTYALFMPPTVPIYNTDGSYNFRNPWESSHFSLNGQQANPVYDLQNSVAESINNSLLANVYARYTIAKDLFAKVTLSTDQGTATQNFFAPKASALGLNEQGVGSIGKKQHEIWQADATLDYSKRIHDVHFFNILGGYTYQDVQEIYQIDRSSHFLNEELKHQKLGFGEVQSPTINGALESRLHSLISRLNYSLLERYNLTATFRADYSSRFAEGKRWGRFPSIGFSWNVDKENFLAEQSTLGVLKLRLTAGTVGNTEIGDYLFSQFYNPQIYNGRPVFVMENLGNSNLTWETTTQYNAGIDAGLFDERVSLVADIYYKETRDLLLEKPAPLGSGVDKQMVNIGNVTNKGIEFGANVVLVNKKNLHWNVAANVARNINTVTSLGADKQILSGQYNEQILTVDEAFGSFYGFVFDGVVQADEDVSQLPKLNGATPKPGDVKYVDVQKDGNIDINDRTILGSIQPDFTYGLSSTLNYQRFDLFVSFQGSQGNKVVNSLRRKLERATSSYNMPATLLDSWTLDNPSNEVPKLTAGFSLTSIDSRYVEDASYFRLKNITLGYTFKAKGATFSARVFVSAQNLFTITKYKGYDPEVANGVDIGAYPTARTFSAGVNLTFDR
ncbi:MAG: TonB-dependent receptor [Prevotellaceae bacterium]|jgi:TonB-linked SusC/RagA family outer membrane protein|nr:TonB-dependent receptor [Prevotellaceae bacterium]